MMTTSKRLLVLLSGVGVVLAVLSALSVVAAQSPSGHEPGMTPQERLAKPPLSDPPTQVELGHAEYWMSCMVCHGDRGQGLTEEWRTVLDPEDMNCWQSRCHAPNHPPQGFEIPRTSPLVIGPGALTGYQTASDLFAYLRVYMPWSFPGLFEDDVYWNLTAYLADANGIDLPKEPLGPGNGDEVLLRPQLVQTHHTAIAVEQIVASAVVGLLLLAAILYWWIRAL
jgi:mono/diheme cytochrome c family protein